MRNLRHIVLAALLVVSSSAYAHAGDISGGFTVAATADISAGKTGDISGGKTGEVSGSFYGDISGGFVDFLLLLTVGL